MHGPMPIFPFGYGLKRAISDPVEHELGLEHKYGKVYGVYTGLLPTLTVNDAELIKNVLVKDFHLFLDRRKLNSYHEIWNLVQFSIEGVDWKRIRAITSPAFTSGKSNPFFIFQKIN